MRSLLLSSLLLVGGCVMPLSSTPTQLEGTFIGELNCYFPGRASTDSLTVVISPPSVVVYLRDLPLPTRVDSLTTTALWVDCDYDDCILRLRTYPGRQGVGASLDSLRGFATLIPNDTLHHAAPGTWRAER